MKKRTRVLLSSSIIILVILIFVYYNSYLPPQTINGNYYVPLKILTEHPEDYENHNIIINLIINNISKDKKIIYYNLNNQILILNCSELSELNINIGDHVYFKGICYINSRGYILVKEYQVVVSYSLHLSIAGLVIVIIILFFVLEFDIKSFSFKIREDEK